MTKKTPRKSSTNPAMADAIQFHEYPRSRGDDPYAGTTWAWNHLDEIRAYEGYLRSHGILP